MPTALVVGGGIGGLTAAVALRRAGYDVRVLEQAPELREVGAGLTVQPNALCALAHVGLDRDVEEAGQSVDEGGLVDWRGRVLQELPLRGAAGGRAPVAIHRHTLQRALLAAAGEEHVTTGARCVGYRVEGERVVVQLADGAEAAGELLVGADGIHSVVRTQMHGDAPPRYSGYTCWRGVAERGDLLPGHRTEERWGPAARFGLVPIDGGRVYWFSTVDAPPGGRDPEGRSREAVLERFGGWASPVPEVVRATPEEAILRNDIIDRPPLERWTDGPVVLLGDAAHAMTPNMGQGACQAIEDAVVLGHLVGRLPLDAALARYVAVRRPRTTWFVETSWRMGAIGQWKGGLARGARDLATRLTPRALVRRQMARAWSFELAD